MCPGDRALCLPLDALLLPRPQQQGAGVSACGDGTWLSRTAGPASSPRHGHLPETDQGMGQDSTGRAEGSGDGVCPAAQHPAHRGLCAVRSAWWGTGASAPPKAGFALSTHRAPQSPSTGSPGIHPSTGRPPPSPEARGYTCPLCRWGALQGVWAQPACPVHTMDTCAPDTLWDTPWNG